MSSRRSSRRSPRRLVLTLAPALAGAGLLSGCEEPTPLVTVVSGTTSVHDEAVCYAFDGGTPPAEECTAGAGDARTLEVEAGQPIGIDVDPDLADAGWVAAVDGQRLTSRTLDDTYYEFSISEKDLGDKPRELQVYELGDDGNARGVWVFRLRPG